MGNKVCVEKKDFSGCVLRFSVQKTKIGLIMRIYKIILNTIRDKKMGKRAFVVTTQGYTNLLLLGVINAEKVYQNEIYTLCTESFSNFYIYICIYRGVYYI